MQISFTAFTVQVWGNNSSFQETEGLHLVDKPVLKTISFDSMNSVKKLGMRHEAAAVLLLSFASSLSCTNSRHTSNIVNAVPADYIGVDAVTIK